ncbi:hypothetical protein MAXJ12_34909 [Mesorhizobium alhagi CCNWXJ12-2]|uniref:Uncharacterized protein n=1 Tax=Mesorhizobium alhagi CCNWXJ12-2 TaxID=1107882 RepID=H0I3B7_9HYPH|nr:hypothetical protein MAXJ12_34909 [Mesorhizobium alhagi CCNWXJ12-2]
MTMTDKRGESDQDYSGQPDKDQEAPAFAKKFDVSLDVARYLLALTGNIASTTRSIGSRNEVRYDGA